MKRKEIDTKYSLEFTLLQDEFFGTFNQGTPTQERRLRTGKSANEFNLKYTEIAERHKAKLLANGFVDQPAPLPRNLAAEIDELKAKVEEPEMDYKAEILKLQAEVKKLKEKR